MVLGIGSFLSDILIGVNAPVFSSPKEKCDLDYDDVEFQTDDQITIRGWWIPADSTSSSSSSKKVIVHTHFGLFCCRSGYTPDGKGMMAPSQKKMEFLKAIPHYRSKGYNVLMFDLRGHGDSDPDHGQQKDDKHFASYGWKEEADVRAAVQFCETTKGMEQIFLYGICMGGTSTTFAFAAEPTDSKALTNNPKIKAMTFIQPITYTQFVENMGIPKFIADMATRVSNDRLGFRLDELTFTDAITKIDVPCLMVQNVNDPFHRREQVQEFF